MSGWGMLVFRWEFFPPALLSALIAVMVAFALNLCALRRERKFRKSDEILKVIYQVCHELEMLSMNYWMESKNRNNDIRMLLVESKIKAAFIRLNHFMDKFFKINPKKEKTIIASWMRLYKTITGGNFEAKNRKADIDRIMPIARVISDFYSSLD